MTTASSRAANRRSPALDTPPQRLPATAVRRERIALALDMIQLVLRDDPPPTVRPLALQAVAVLRALARAVKER